MHILFLTDNFPPEVNAPATRTFEHATNWVKCGHKVTVITCAPNFPDGKLFNNYTNRLWQTELIEGVCVIRVWSYITANEGVVRRTLDYVSYMASAIAASPFVRDIDLVIGTSPQFFTAVGAYVVSRLRRVPFVFELRDIWPESIRAVGAMQDSIAMEYLEKLELFLYKKANLIISVTAAFKDKLAKRGIDPGKIQIVTNGIDLRRFGPRKKDTQLVANLGFEEKFVVGYIGTHGMAHALETVLDAAANIQEQRQDDRFRFLLLGSGARKADLMERARKQGLRNITFLETVCRDHVARYWSLLDVSIIHLKDNDVFRSVIPSKLFECMAMGIPVLHGVAGESASIVEAEQVGLLFKPENASDLCRKLMLIENDSGLRAKLSEAAVKAAPKYDRSKLAEQMLRHLQEVATH